ncbi:Lysosomal alpha-mannosidase [Geodia barretti]|uniref:Lysosomal alpha-mannosidase n=1 Tax=Geodia barretti TaxID=519541 RepID=A0AA35RJ13_GEOBA|nr:Lysosomal alpha-mannosidase [Geodia barretti]
MASLAAVCLLLLAVATVAVTASDDKIYVHIVPHTHDDVGWLKTVDEYFYGANNSIQHAGVQYILDTVVDELQKNPNRTFIYVEMAFFVRWWNEQTDETKQIVRKLVTETRQLEFINAGWCMNDEAATDYNAIIDQMSIGLRFVEENFGPSARPRVGWHIDPFGHSSQMASIHSQLGMDGFFFARIDYDDKNQRLSDKTMEMVWQSSQSLGAAGDIFTGVLYYFYGPPPGFCFDVRCSDQPIQDDPKLFGYNVDGRVASFVKAAQEQAAHYASNHIMFTMGSDFNYENALEWYKNLDKLVHYVNKKMDDPRLEGYNADERAAQFLFLIREQAVFYPSKHIMLTMGSDFNYENARREL